MVRWSCFSLSLLKRSFLVPLGSSGSTGLRLRDPITVCDYCEIYIQYIFFKYVLLIFTVFIHCEIFLRNSVVSVKPGSSTGF